MGNHLWYGGADLVYALVAGALAFVVLAADLRAARNRMLGGYLLCLAANAAAANVPEIFGEEPAWLGRITGVVVYSTFFPLPFLYLAFVARAVDTSIVRPWRRPAVSALLVVLAVASTAVGVALGIAAMARGSFDPVSAAAGAAVGAGSFTVFALAIVVSLAAVRRHARGTVQRRRAVAYAWAFGLHDLGLMILIGPDVLDLPALASTRQYVVSTFFAVLGLVLLARALLVEQLFDFDLKLKWTVRRGTLAGVFVAAFFVATAIAEQYLQQRFGLVAGGIVVGLLLFALRPLERAADRVANAAMPRVQDTQEYRTVRKREVYRAAVEGALSDGEISEKERDVLARVADQLGLSAAEALAVEREARTAVHDAR